MSLKIIYGKSGVGKSTFIFNEIAEKIKSGNKKKNIYNNSRAVFIYSRKKIIGFTFMWFSHISGSSYI